MNAVPIGKMMPALANLMSQLLQVDAVIIAEDDDNVVLTVRVPKAVIRSNGYLISALFDAAHRNPGARE